MESFEKEKINEYFALFLRKKGRQASRQSVYISQRVHRIISKIVNVVSDKGITVGGYIDSILEEHLETHKDEIIEFYRNEMSKNDEGSLYS